MERSASLSTISKSSGRLASSSAIWQGLKSHISKLQNGLYGQKECSKPSELALHFAVTSRVAEAARLQFQAAAWVCWRSRDRAATSRYGTI